MPNIKTPVKSAKPRKVKTKVKLNMKSILAAARDNGCTDGNTLVDIFDYAASKGYTKGVISETWLSKIQGWRSYNQKAIETLYERSQSYPGDYVTVPDDIIKLLKKNTHKATRTPIATTPKKETSTMKMNLRTLLHKCYENHIEDANTALDILQRMKDAGYEISDTDIDFAQGWKKFNNNAFKKMTENTFNGSNGFAKRELLDCDNFDSFLPIQKLNGSGKTLNVRTVLDRFYSKKCTDALKIAATLQDLEIAGYEGVELYNIPGLINKTVPEVEEMLLEAHNGTGYFEGQDILDCPNF